MKLQANKLPSLLNSLCIQKFAMHSLLNHNCKYFITTTWGRRRGELGASSTLTRFYQQTASKIRLLSFDHKLKYLGRSVEGIRVQNRLDHNQWVGHILSVQNMSVEKKTKRWVIVILSHATINTSTIQLSFHNSVIDTEDHQQMPWQHRSQLVRQAGLKQGIELRVRS